MTNSEDDFHENYSIRTLYQVNLKQAVDRIRRQSGNNSEPFVIDIVDRYSWKNRKVVTSDTMNNQLFQKYLNVSMSQYDIPATQSIS
jgi:hypothetical protein